MEYKPDNLLFLFSILDRFVSRKCLVLSGGVGPEDSAMDFVDLADLLNRTLLIDWISRHDPQDNEEEANKAMFHGTM